MPAAFHRVAHRRYAPSVASTVAARSAANVGLALGSPIGRYTLRDALRHDHH